MEEEMVIDILRQLPVKSLLRFKCVSQSWYTFVSRPDFKKKHLLHSKKHPEMIIQPEWKMDLQLYTYYNEIFSCSSLLSRRTVEDLQLLNWESGIYYRIYACYDGLVLLGAPYSLLVLWNPSTRELIQLPEENLDFRDDFKLYGLGYDETCNDYKVFKVGDDCDDGDPTTEILALKSGSWRIIDGGRRDCSFTGDMDCLAFVGGAFHWICETWSSIISFHVSKEVYGEVPLPEEFVEPEQGVTELGVTELGGMLSIHSCVYENNEGRLFHLWVLKEYGVKESWTKLFIIQDTMITSFKPIIPKYMFEDGEVLLKCRGGMIRISEGRNGPVVRKVIDEKDNLQNGYVLTESLISSLVVNH